MAGELLSSTPHWTPMEDLEIVLVSLLFPDPAADEAALMSGDSNEETVS